jgi:aminoglycoside 3-N-acetyltransferase I
MLEYRRLGKNDAELMRALNALFAEAFEDPDSYASAPPDAAYLAGKLADPNIVVLVATDSGAVVGGLAAYILPKLEQARSEIYIYDLAVAEEHRRQGIATGLIDRLRAIGRDCSAWVIYVQADYGDEPAIALYTKLGLREDVMHFDIDVAEDEQK